MGVNSPEWRPEVCSPRRRRYPGPTGPELEAAAGMSGGRIPGAASPPPDRPRVHLCSPGPRPRGWRSSVRWLGPPCDCGPAGRGQGAVPAAKGACGKRGIWTHRLTRRAWRWEMSGPRLMAAVAAWPFLRVYTEGLAGPISFSLCEINGMKQYPGSGPQAPNIPTVLALLPEPCC